jgi:hypothetical protein
MKLLVKPGMVCFDIGGQYGWHALSFAKLGAKVVTFEPDAEVLQGLRRNLELNPYLKVDVVERSVGTGALRLDELGPADFIKVDVDGGELDVLRSAGETLGRVSGLIVETHSPDLERDCGRLLMDQGLRARVVSQRGSGRTCVRFPITAGSWPSVDSSSRVPPSGTAIPRARASRRAPDALVRRSHGPDHHYLVRIIVGLQSRLDLHIPRSSVSRGSYLFAGHGGQATHEAEMLRRTTEASLK